MKTAIAAAAPVLPASPVTTTALASFDQPVLDAADKVNHLLTALRSSFHEREVETLLLVLAYMTREHVLLLGPHGTAKTLLAVTFAQCLGIDRDDVFTYLLGKFTMPDEVFGPVDLPSMKQGVTRRVTQGKLPEALVGVLDECFKSNSSILNSLLTITNEREFDNPDPVTDLQALVDQCVAAGVLDKTQAAKALIKAGQQVNRTSRKKVPLETLVGLSNELPEGGPEGPLGPLYDRFIFRRWTSYISDDTLFEQLIENPVDITVTATVSRQEMEVLRDAVPQVSLTGLTGLLDDNGNDMRLSQVISRKLKKGLEAKGIVVSDRRWRKAMKAVRAHAVLHGRTVAVLADLAPLAHVLWDEPDMRQTVKAAVEQLANADVATARKLFAANTSLRTKLGDDPTPQGWTDKASEAARKIKANMAKMSKLQASPEIDKMISTSNEYCNDLFRLQQSNFGL